MKVNWVSPLAPARTDIANFTARVLPALSHRADVRVWTEQSDWNPAFGAIPVSRLPQPGAFCRAFHEADISFYNIGNNCEFHAHTWEFSRTVPGVVILHDQCLQHLFAGYYLGKKNDFQEWLRHMSRYYHARGYRAAVSYLGQRLGTEALAAEYPLTPLAVEDALGVLVHSKVTFETLEKFLLCPIRYSPLPYPVTRNPELERWEQIRRARPAGPPFRVVLYGYVGPNRRLKAILDALAGLPGREQIRLDLYGTLWDEKAVSGWIQAAGLGQIVTFHGFVDDLDAALAGVDLALNLRNPSMGEASGTQLRIWDHGLPSLVSRTGWYATLPEDTVLSVDPEHEVEDVRAHLLGFLAHPESYRGIGRNGRFTLEEEHAPEDYVEALLALAAEAQAFRPSLAALKLADRVGLELKSWPVAAARLAAGDAAMAIKSLCWREAEASQASAHVGTTAPAWESDQKGRTA